MVFPLAAAGMVSPLEVAARGTAEVGAVYPSEVAEATAEVVGMASPSMAAAALVRVSPLVEVEAKAAAPVVVALWVAAEGALLAEAANTCAAWAKAGALSVVELGTLSEEVENSPVVVEKAAAWARRVAGGILVEEEKCSVDERNLVHRGGSRYLEKGRRSAAWMKEIWFTGVDPGTLRRGGGDDDKKESCMEEGMEL
ncbi:hypothetical protein HPP92_009653 [Vanilla planifolia]|uniref:Uncharacterized protein n=1 Tax=Vanilla planifolia TaxID=51239 RepID=A0A835V321_VANPL|nr:hypothetical protein HPP92_009653 [Vanilla planifolia]